MDFEQVEKIADALAKTHMQNPCSFRALAWARILAGSLIDEKGTLLKKELPDFPSGVQGGNSKEITKHFEFVLNSLHSHKELLHLFYRFKMPVADRYIERLIRCSLALPLDSQITHRELRKGVLTALLTPLRQNIGSCFATAPAIFIQSEQIERLLLDLYDLIMTNSLSRIVDGVKQRVPISPSWGVGDLRKPVRRNALDSPALRAALAVSHIPPSKVNMDGITVEDLIQSAIAKHCPSQQAELFEKNSKDTFKAFTDHALLKTWEYTIASFSDFKIEFYKWNLFASLGFDHQEKGGIGHLLYTLLEEKLKKVQAKAKESENHHSRAIDEARLTQGLLRQASDYRRARQLKLELDLRIYHAESCKEMCIDLNEHARHLSGFFKFLLEQYAKKFSEYFQEIYDADMRDLKSASYEDAPAGFRLLYKHGRATPLAWTLIHDKETYVQSLVSFFMETEPQIAAACGWEGGEKELQELTTCLIHHLRTDEFLDSAIKRMERIHGKEQEIKNPWSYTSGGTVSTLIRCYYSLEKEPSEERCTPRSPLDLLVFLLDLMKELPYKRGSLFEKNLRKGMLMYSPKHVFIFRPGLGSFKEGWLNGGFSYTWARDQTLTAGMNFYDKICLSCKEQQLLADEFCESYLPRWEEVALAKTFTPRGAILDLPNFRTHLFESLRGHVDQEIALLDQIDGFLRIAFPLIERSEIEELLKSFPREVDPLFFETLQPVYTFSGAYNHLFKCVKCFDFLDRAFKERGLTPPDPVLFADTNWAWLYLGFAYNPAIKKLDLWCLDFRSLSGYPLSSWRSAIDGSALKPWGVFIDPSEYSRIAPRDFAILQKRV